MAKLTHVTENIDLADWNLDSVEESVGKLKSIVLSAAAEAIEYAMEEGACAYFPIEWNFPWGSAEAEDGVGGPKCDDPFCVYVRLPFDNGGEMPTWKFDLRETVEECIDGLIRHDTGVVGTDHRASLEALREGFLELAARITRALETKKPGTA